MQKREDSIRSLGHTVLHVDKPLRAKIKALAESEGMLMIEYLRALADREIANKQIPLATGQVSSPGRIMGAIAELGSLMLASLTFRYGEYSRERQARLEAELIEFCNKYGGDIPWQDIVAKREEAYRSGDKQLSLINKTELQESER